MKVLALILGLSCTICFASSVEYRVVEELEAREAHVQMLLTKVRSEHRGDLAYIAAFDAAQKKWEEYCTEMLELRFPEKKTREAYGSADHLAYAAARRDMLEARIKDLLSHTKPTKPASDDAPKKNG